MRDDIIQCHRTVLLHPNTHSVSLLTFNFSPTYHGRLSLSSLVSLSIALPLPFSRLDSIGISASCISWSLSIVMNACRTRREGRGNINRRLNLIFSVHKDPFSSLSYSSNQVAFVDDSIVEIVGQTRVSLYKRCRSL